MAAAPDAVEEKKASETGEAPAMRAGGASGAPGPWREASTALALALFFPGAGHIYAGRWRRGILWSVLFLAVAFPGALFAYGVWSSFNRSALAGCGLFLLAVLLASAIGPMASVWKRARTPRVREPRPALHVVGLYAAAIAIITACEAILFLRSVFETRRVASANLEPVLARGVLVTVLRSLYVHPVHGDVVLFRAQDAPGGAGAERLARVLALPRDAIEARGGKLLVNGIEIDFSRNDQRLALEKAGRAERTRRFLPFLGSQPAKDHYPGKRLTWSQDWGPVELGGLLVVPDGEAAPEDASGRAPGGLIIPEGWVLGRVPP